ncbi:protease inhibitor I42 family protein [Pseudaeromonas sharmana]|uniref:Protease inhibitor I42 family protein n=1 Tax=Pseudaeromonas sharmana TaxID=328412 RepID=A0ABV8CL31_9GAMM
MAAAIGHRWRLGMAFGLMLGLNACQQAAPPQVSVPLKTAGPELTMAQNGSSVTLAVGDALAIALPGALQTGYQWQVVQTPALVNKQGSEYQPLSGSGECGMQRLWFAARQPGDGLLTLVYRSEGAGHQDDANFYTLRLHIRQGR